MRKHTKIAVFGLCAMLALSPVTAFADETAEDAATSLENETEAGNAYYYEAEHGPQTSDEDCSLNITFTCDGTAIDGASITITKVMDVNLDLGRFYPIGDLAEIYGEEITLDDLPSIGQQSMAKEISGSSSKPKAGETQVTDKRGEVHFKTVNIGMYLVEQTGKTGTAADYTTFAPFLISIPSIAEDGSLIYEVECLPKTGVVKETTPETPSETPPVPTLGLEFNSLTGLPMMLMGGMLSLLAVGGMAGGLTVYAKKRK